MKNRTTTTAATLGGAIGLIIVAILSGVAHADISPELGAAITTVCVAICGLVFPLA